MVGMVGMFCRGSYRNEVSFSLRVRRNIATIPTIATRKRGVRAENTPTDTSRSMLGARGCRYPDSNYGR